MKKSGRAVSVTHEVVTAAQSPAPKKQAPAYASTPDIFPGRKWRWIAGALLLLMTILAYQQVWRAGFIWDDDKYVTANPLLAAADGLKRIWFSLDSPSQYFPLVYTSFRFEHALWGLHPAGYHWVNILLHGVNALLVWTLLRALRVPGAWLAAALFALHPVQMESVAWITERKNVLMGFFFLLSLLCWVRFVEIEAKDRLNFYFAALVAYALALFSKTTACTLPAALLLVLWLKRKPISLQRVAQVTPFVVLGVAMGLVSVWWEKYHQGTQGALFSIGPLDRVLVASHAVWFYLGKLLWPAQLAFSYPRWPISTANPLDYIWLLLIVAMIVAVWFGRRHFGRGVEVALLYFVATLSPVLGFIMLYTFRYSWVADHYQYLASIGPLALAAAAISISFDRLEKLKAPLFALACSVLLVALGVRTWKQGAIYANQETLWRATIAANPKSWMAYNNLAIEALKAGRTEEALAGYRKAIELDPAYTEAHYNLANALMRVDRTEEAIASYEKALSFYPRFAAAHANLGAALLKVERAEEAINHLRKAIKIDPRMASAQQSLGNALLHAGQGTEAIVHLGKAMEMDPTLPRIEHDLAVAFAQSGGREQAADHWKKALEIDPDDVAAHSAIGMRLAENGRVEESLLHFRKVAQSEPESAEAHYNLATALSRTGRLEEAIAHYREALRLKPDYAAAHVNLATTFGQAGRLEEAVGEFYLALDLRPDSAAAHRNLGITLHMLGRDDEAEPHMRRAAELESAPPKP